MTIQIVTIAYFAVLVLVSLLAFFMYGADKRKAGAGGGPERTKESRLLAVAAYGGAAGALIGRIVFRHKTRKLYFSLVIYVSLLVQIGVAVLLCLLMGGAL